jgi:two-component system cell cycle response regulator DivK
MERSLVTKEAVQTEVNMWVGKNILIAEDIELNFLYLRELLKSTGVMIIRAQNGKEAVQYCMEDPKVDLVLMDLLMPIMNGYEATRQIKTFRQDLPIIAQTAYVMSEDRAHAIAAGCDDFIAKPIGKEDLFGKIDRLLNQNKEKEVQVK